MYTSHGWMTAADLADHREQTDTGTITISLDDAPTWLGQGECPICDEGIPLHDSVLVARVDGEIVACLPDGASRWRHPEPTTLPFF